VSRVALRAGAAALALLAGGAPAHDETRAQLEQRIRLTATLLGDSPAAQRIVGSGNAQAVAHLDDGRVHHALSEDALARGDLVAARKAADEALRHLALARRMVPDAPARAAAAKARHAQMLSHLERLIESWRQRLPPGEADDGDRIAALGLMDTARYLASGGRHEEGVHVLAAAESHVLAGMNRLLSGARELDYTQRAATPAEEFQLELQRHQSLADLVPLALSELRPRPEAVALIGRYGEASRSLREQALLRQEAGETAQALADLRNASLFLQRALGAAGVALPTPTGATP
jgi:hypothetical protein